MANIENRNSEQLMSDDDRKGLLLGSLASGVLSAIIGARSGNIDPMAAGLAGAGTAFAGGSKQISDIRQAAQNQRFKEKQQSLAEEAAVETARHRRNTELYYTESGKSLAAQRAETAKLSAERTAALQTAAAEQAQIGPGLTKLSGLYTRTRPETEQEALSGLMPEAEARTPEMSELLATFGKYPALGKSKVALQLTKPAPKPGYDLFWNDDSENWEYRRKEPGPVVGAVSPMPVKVAETKTTTQKEETQRKEDRTDIKEEKKEAKQEERQKTTDMVRVNTYGPKGVTKEEWVKKGTDPVLREGWSLERPKEKKGIAATMETLQDFKTYRETKKGEGEKKLPADFPAPGPEGQKRRLPDGSIVTSKSGKWQ